MADTRIALGSRKGTAAASLIVEAFGDAVLPQIPEAIGRAILRAAPWLMKALSVAGTAAMFLVGGGILVHGLAPLHHWIADRIHDLSGFNATLAEMGFNAAVGLLAGALLLALVSGARRLRPAAGH